MRFARFQKWNNANDIQMYPNSVFAIPAASLSQNHRESGNIVATAITFPTWITLKLPT